MKKLFICVMSVAALSLAACGNKTNQSEGADSLAAETELVEQANEVVTKLQAAVESGDAAEIQALIEEATEAVENLSEEEKAKYAYKLQEFLATNQEKLEAASVTTTTISDVVNAVVNLPENASNLATDAAEAAKSDAQQIATETKEAAVNAANEKVEETKAAAVEKANSTVDEAAQKVNDKVNEGLSKAAGKLKL